MLKKLSHKFKTWNSSHILAVLFLMYIFYVGGAAVPQLLTNLQVGLQHGAIPVNIINTQYESMLSTEKQYPLLQNKGTYINLSGFMAKLLDQPMLNKRVTLKNGHLTSLFNYSYTEEEVQSTADNIAVLHQEQAARGKHFLFVLTPVQVSKYEDLLPAGYTDNSNELADRFLTLLAERGIPYLDLRESMAREKLSHTDAFYVTDHHWTSRTGFWAYTKIMEKLQDMNAVSTVPASLLEADNYEFRTYEDFFLGSSGKRTGIYYAGLDDFSIILPKFETDLQVKIPSDNLDVRGSYEDVAYRNNISEYFSVPDFFNNNPYVLFGRGDTPATYWYSANAPVEAKCLLIGDSFGNIPFSLMANCFTSCDELDMRHYTMDFASHYADLSPDIVVLQVNTGSILSEQNVYPYFPNK